MSEKIRVLVADDHAIVRRGLKLFLDLQDDLEVVGEAADGGEAIERARELRPDVVVMDLVMPNTNGVEATLAVKESSPETNVLVLSSFVDDESVRSVLRAGATGYLLKDAQPEEVAAAIRTVHRGDPLLHPDVLRRVVREVAEPEAGGGEGRDAPSGTVTIAVTDIENSTPLIRDLGDEAALPVFREHDRMVREVVSAHGGREVQHLGDGFMLAFGSARAAVWCAIDVQRAFAQYEREHADRPLRVRAGIHTGEVIAEERGYFGEAVWFAFRIASKAEGGQILVSDLTRRLVGPSCACRDRGEFTLKGMPGVHRLYEVEWVQT